jgi:GxxExxY protein
MGEATEHTEKAPSDAFSRPCLLHEDLTKLVRQTAFEVHRYFGGGFLEAVYRSALRNRLRKQGLEAAPCRFTVRDEDGTAVGSYEADLVVAGKVVVELKAVSGLRPEHESQTLNYLKAADLRVGLLINFGRKILEVRRLIY